MKGLNLILIVCGALAFGACEKSSTEQGSAARYKAGGIQYVDDDFVNDVMQETRYDLLSTVIPAIKDNPDPYLNSLNDEDREGLLIQIYQDYGLTDLASYKSIKRVPTLSLDMGRIRSHEEVDPANINLLAIEEQQDTMDTYTAYDIASGEVVPINEVANGQPYLSLSESNILSAVYDNGKNIYGEDFIRLDQLDTIYPVTGVLVDSLPLHIYKKWDFFVSGGWSGNSGPQEEDDCLRDKRDNKEYISKIKFQNHNSLNYADESWLWRNTLMFKVIIGYSETINGNTKAKKLDKIIAVDDHRLWDYVNWSRVPTKTWVSITNIIHWTPNDIAKRIKYKWLEIDDDGKKTTSTFTVPSSEIDDGNGNTINTPSVSVEYEKNPKDDELGSAIVSYCDNSAWPGYKYGTGSLYFWVGD